MVNQFSKRLPTKKQLRLIARDSKGFLRMSLEEFREFLEDIELLAKDLKRSSSLREVILLTDLVVEKVLNELIIKILGLKPFKKSGVDIEVVKSLSFDKKIEIIKILKKTYKKPLKHRSFEGIAIDKELIPRVVKDKRLLNKLIKIEEEYKKENKIPFSIYNPSFDPKITFDYLEEEKFRILEGVAKNILVNMKSVRDSRNVVAHRINYEKSVAEKLGVTLSDNLFENVKGKCASIIEEIGFKIIK